MSDESRRHLRLEMADGIAVVHFIASKIVTEEDIQEISDQLNRFVDEDGHRRLLLNFDNVRYLSSATLGKLINLKKKLAKDGGQLKLCSIYPDLLEVFKITRLDTVFEILPDEPTALRTFA